MIGIRAAIFLLCIALSVSMLAGIGFYNEAGISIAPGLEGDMQEVEDEMGQDEFELDDTGGIFGLFDLATAAVDGVMILWTLITSVGAALQAFGVPAEIANPMGSLITILFGLGIFQIIRGFTFE